MSEGFSSAAGFLTALGYDTSVMMRSIPLRGFDQAYFKKQKKTAVCVSSHCILLYVFLRTASDARLRAGVSS
jgi:hypothetical protein